MDITPCLQHHALLVAMDTQATPWSAPHVGVSRASQTHVSSPHPATHTRPFSANGTPLLMPEPYMTSGPSPSPSSVPWPPAPAEGQHWPLAATLCACKPLPPRVPKLPSVPGPPGVSAAQAGSGSPDQDPRGPGSFLPLGAFCNPLPGAEVDQTPRSSQTPILAGRFCGGAEPEWVQNCAGTLMSGGLWSQGPRRKDALRALATLTGWPTMALTHPASHWAVAHGHTKKKPTARPPQGPPSQPRDPNRGFQRLKHEHAAHSSPRPGTPVPRLHSRPCPADLRVKGPQWDRGPLTAPHLCAPSVPFLSAPCVNHAQSCLHPSSSHPASVCHRGPTASSEQEGAATQQALGTAGVMISLSRILTKLLLPDERASTLIFFLVSVALELLCFLLHLLVRRSRFVLFYTTRPRDSRRGRPGLGKGSGYRVHHDVAAGDVHFEHPAPAPAPSGSPKDSPAHEVTGSGGAYMRFDVPRPRVQRSWPTFRALLLHRYVVARVIWADMLSIAVTYFITLCLFPGLESEIRHCILGEWLPILIMAVFNLSDFVGKILAALPVDWRGTHLLACSCLRIVFIPLFILCVYPSGTPALRHPAWPCIFSLLMGISNGYFGSVPMILAAGKVSPKQRELAGNTMTVSYMSGLTLGSAVAYCTYSLTRDAHGSCLHPSTANGSILSGL
ncbi:PREDICTED: equilibrative nucleoside transporter 4 isoform X2 [Cercocebus atys]|uniref:equilibrative nucleoside transporter 4 isoform X2 n=1 Tax=Cercocebus atys TaxID=9531 RepID=UPI0005F3866A|nr:PREDICTED: equilibrative nucleoside transporter 4 isoform X2 [Cercocebus atys]